MDNVMDRIAVALGDYPLKGEPYTAITAPDRQAMLDLLDAVKGVKGRDGYFEITMPCGYSRVLKKHKDIPFEDLPCQCGQEGRYLIRYKKE